MVVEELLVCGPLIAHTGVWVHTRLRTPLEGRGGEAGAGGMWVGPIGRSIKAYV